MDVFTIFYVLKINDMRKKQCLLMLACIAIASVACKKNGVNSGNSVSNDLSVKTLTVPLVTTNPFGALINATDGVTFTAAQKKTILLNLQCKYARMNIVVTGFSGSASQYDLFANAGLTMVLNVSNDPTGGTHPFVTDTAAYKLKLDSVLDVYQPEVLVIENEETTTNYHSGPITDYFNELKAAVNVAHAHGIPVTNGGIVARAMTLLTWKSYIDSGLVSKASAYAAKAFPPSKLVGGKPDTTVGSSYQTLLVKGRQMIAMYTSLPLDYVNFHWYEPVRAVGAANLPGLDTIAHVNSALEESICYLRSVTGKNILTNEIGQYNDQTGITTAIMDEMKRMNIPYAIWYSGDGSTGKARALQNGDLTLRATGTTFKNYIIANY